MNLFNPFDTSANPGNSHRSHSVILDRYRWQSTVNRVVHGCHFWAIFESFLNHFPFHSVSIFLKIETENERRMNKKWNPNLAVAKMDLENDHFGSVPGEKNAFSHHFFSRVFMVTIFQIIFIPFCLFLCQIHENEPKMSLKWAKNVPRMATM